LYYSHGANNARGVAILIRNKFDCIVQESVPDADGRFLMLKVLLDGEQALLVNVYGPDRDSQLSSFHQNLLTHILEKGFDTIDNIITGGNFNCPLNPIVDKRGGNRIPRQSVINSTDYLQSEMDLHDISRIKNPTLRSFTWSQSEPLIFSRLDYRLISNFLSDCATEVDIVPAIKADFTLGARALVRRQRYKMVVCSDTRYPICRCPVQSLSTRSRPCTRAWALCPNSGVGT